jgi:hypothetical protein
MEYIDVMTILYELSHQDNSINWMQELFQAVRENGETAAQFLFDRLTLNPTEVDALLDCIAHSGSVTLLTALVQKYGAILTNWERVMTVAYDNEHFELVQYIAQIPRYTYPWDDMIDYACYCGYKVEIIEFLINMGATNTERLYERYIHQLLNRNTSDAYFNKLKKLCPHMAAVFEKLGAYRTEQRAVLCEYAPNVIAALISEYTRYPPKEKKFYPTDEYIDMQQSLRRFY